MTSNQEKWKKHYDKLCIRGQKRAATRKLAMALLECVVEVHHIIPKCMGGDNAKSNLVYLTPREHYIAHQLLVKMYPHQLGLAFACLKMCEDKYGHRVNNRMYGWIKQKNSKQQSLRQKGQTKENNELVRRRAENQKGKKKPKLSLALKGRTKETDPSLQLRADKLRGRTKETCPSIAAAAKKRTGRTKETCEGLARMSASKSGRTKETCEGVRKTADAIRGRTKYNHPSTKQISETLSILNFEQREYLVYLRDIEKMSLKNILKHLNEDLNVKIAYTTLSNTYQRHKKDLIIINNKIFTSFKRS